jgi:choice-of-anchor C domain-containing protein
MTRTKGSIRFRVSAVAVLVVVGVASLVGMSVVPRSTGAAPTNLLTNGSFETTPTPTTSFITVLAGDSTTIPGWTVVTPAIYGGEGGSVDLKSNNYWNAEDGNYSIDLAGSTGVPGGLYQDVTTTPGVQYLLSYWSAVNGDETPGNTHTLDVTINGVVVAQVQQAGVGRPLDWVQHTVTVTATSTTTQVEFDDVPPGDTNQRPALDNVSLTAVPDSISASPATIAPQTTATSFTAPVATFTDSYPAAPLGNFSATVNWGDGTSSAGIITQPGGSGTTFAVSGTHTYTAHGTYTVGVTVNSIAGGTASVSDSVTVADAVTTCTGSGCSGTVTTTQQSVSISSTSTSGTILTTVDPADQGTFSCGDPFRHAPQVTTVTDTNLNANILYTVTFKNKAAAGQWFVPFAVCYQAQTPFKDLYGRTVTTGLLPLCTLIPRPNRPLVAPCVESISELPLFLGNVVEKIVVPPGDPRYH